MTPSMRLRISLSFFQTLQQNQGTFIKKERSYGSMTRQFYLRNVDEDKAKAKYTDGVLRLTLPKLSSKEITKKQLTIE